MEKIGQNRVLQNALDAYSAALQRDNLTESDAASAELDRLLGTRSPSTDALARYGVRSYDPERKEDNEPPSGVHAPDVTERDAPEDNEPPSGVHAPDVTERDAPTVEALVAQFDPVCTRANSGVGGFGPDGKSRAAGNREIAQAMTYASPQQALTKIYQREDAGFLRVVVSGSNVTSPGGIPPHLRGEAVIYSNVTSIELWGNQVRQDEREARRERVKGWFTDVTDVSGGTSTKK